METVSTEMTEGSGSNSISAMQAQLDAARHAFERVVFTRYAEDVVRGEKTPGEAEAFIVIVLCDFDRIVSRANDGLHPEIYAERRRQRRDYVAEVRAVLAKVEKARA